MTATTQSPVVEVHEYASIDDGMCTYTDAAVLGATSTRLLIRVPAGPGELDSFAVLDTHDQTRVREIHHTVHEAAAWCDLLVSDTGESDLYIIDVLR